MSTSKILNWQLAILALLVTVSVAGLLSRSQAFIQIDVGGHSLRTLKIEGGTPAVVFENGLGNTLGSWIAVQSEVSAFATTVSYDRANTGRSEDGPLPRDARQVATELHNLLQNSETEPPYILVGASLGGLFVRTYAAMFPEEVSALVLVDPSRDDEIPEKDWVRSLEPEVDAFPVIRNQARESIIPPEIPIYLIAAMGFQKSPYLAIINEDSRKKYEEANLEKLSAYKEWLKDRANSQLIITHDSRHLVSYEQPELIVRTIRQAIDSTTK